MELRTKRLALIAKTREQVLVDIEKLSPEVRAEVSPVWLARIQSMETPDVWMLGFGIFHHDLRAVIGGCGFKGPPDAAGAVEISYGIDVNQRGNGYATEAAEAMVAYAFFDDRVRIVLAHTLSSTGASARVLTKSGFRYVGQVIDPEDGEVCRWERSRDA